MFAIIADLIIRTSLSADLPFIYDSWLTNFQHTSYFAKRIPKQTFMKCHAILLNMIMERPKTVIKIAGDKDYTIFGYCVAEHITTDPVIHYVYVRPEFQHFGIAKALIQSLNLKSDFQVSHWTPVLNEIEKKVGRLIYNPYLI